MGTATSQSAEVAARVTPSIAAGTRPLSRIFFKILLAEQIFWLIFGLAKFLQKLQN